MERFSFGDSPAMADKLLALVLQGRKTATSCAAVRGPLARESGTRLIVTDGRGRPRAIIEATELTRRRFDEVDESFARDEGEGDLSLDYWRRVHRAFFTREGTFSESMELYCTRFRLVEVLGD